jgi:hypothetical protein
MKNRFYLNARKQPAKQRQANNLYAYASAMRDKLIKEYPDWRIRFAEMANRILVHAEENGMIPLQAVVAMMNAKAFDKTVKGLAFGIGLQLSVEALTPPRRRIVPLPPDQSTYADEIEEGGVAIPPPETETHNQQQQ